eukprot:7736511-Heterocapsa_arctica.AAC.1
MFHIDLHRRISLAEDFDLHVRLSKADPDVLRRVDGELAPPRVPITKSPERPSAKAAPRAK